MGGCGFCRVLGWLSLLAALIVAAPSAQARQDDVGGKRGIVILIDNHIFTHLPFHFDETRLRASIRSMLETVRPARVVVFAVGHDGHAQYPSRYFPPQRPSKSYPLLKEPGQDLMRIWREETMRARTGMIVYVSTLRNDALAEARPDYLRVFGNGLRATVIDHNSAYIDEVLLPGLQEIIDNYQPGGFFLDADYWTLHESWHPATTAGFAAATGLAVPRDYGDPSYPAFVRYTYDSYRERYVAKLAAFFDRQRRPLNWSINAAFTMRDPSPVPAGYGTVTVDLPFFALGEAWLESLFSQRLDGDAEIVYPLFAQSEGATPFQYKGKAQLRQELAVAAANRSLTSFYLPLGPDGVIPLDRIQSAIEVYDEIERRIGMEPVPPDQELLASVAVVNATGDALATRRFGEIRAVSLRLFAQGIPHALTTEPLAGRGGYSHVVFPRFDHPLDPGSVAELASGGKKVLLAVRRRAAHDRIVASLMASDADADFARMPAAACPASVGCEAFRASRGGGEVWFVPSIDDALLDRFLADVRNPVRFPDKPDYVHALAYSDAEGQFLSVYLASVAWGGYAFGRHALFDAVDLVPAVTVEFDETRSCIQRTLAGEVSLPPGRRLTLHPFDTLTRLEGRR